MFYHQKGRKQKKPQLNYKKCKIHGKILYVEETQMQNKHMNICLPLLAIR
jgi:hypothetical protein